MASDRPRNTEAMRASPRCGAKTRSGAPCQAPAVFGKKRCRMHGGSKGTGATKGNKNALKHGAYTDEARRKKKFINDLVKRARKLASEIE